MTPAPKKPSIRSFLARLTTALETFRSYRDEVPLHMVVVFLLIAQRKGVSAGELVKLTGLSQSAVSRNVRALGRGTGDEQGLGLVSQMIDPKNSRAHVIRLTAKGAAVAREMAGVHSTAAAHSRSGPAREQPPDLTSKPHMHWENWMD
jgi:DNA-binding MarR family transcriptional regulator